MTPTSWPRTTLLLALAQPAATALIFGLWAPEGGFERGREPTPVSPAGYAFSIWTPIYLGSIAHGAACVAGRPLAAVPGLAPAVTYAACVAWLVLARLDLVWGTVACIVVMLAGLLTAVRRLARSGAEVARVDRWLVERPLGLYTGWVALATFANVAAAVWGSGLEARLLGAEPLSLIFVCGAGLAGAAIVRVIGRAGLAAAAALGWGLVGIVCADLARTGGGRMSIAAGAGLVLTACAVVAAWPRRSS